MPGALASLSTAETVTLILAGVLVVLVALIGYRAWKFSRITPAERERRRRRALAAFGKMADATLVELRGEMLFYSYDVRGVEYTACQDIGPLKAMLPPELVAAAPVSVKYDPRNPANSIVLAEQWSGLRVGKPH
ncbi:MAG TPA: hypothetical protein VME43_16785 [Bryobacteraceae bacterium]|nr:hypothetical protein [Bryobacteraceae bacterium]